MINKIDLPHAETERVAHELERVVGFSEDEIILASAKEGSGIDEILEAVRERVPPPEGDGSGGVKALIFDSKYDAYKGVLAHVRVVGGGMHGRADCA